MNIDTNQQYTFTRLIIKRKYNTHIINFNKKFSNIQN